jgi:hypothetical protein
MAVRRETQAGRERKSDDCLNQTDLVRVSTLESAKKQCPVGDFQEDISMFRAALLLRVCDSIGSVGPRLETGPDASRGNVVGAAAWILFGAMAGLVTLSAALYSLPTAPHSYVLRVTPFVLFAVFFGALLAKAERPKRIEVHQSPIEEPESVRIGVTAAGIHVRKGSDEKTLPWTDIVAFGETPAAFVLYASSDVVHVLPKRALPRRPETIYAVRSLLRTNVTRRYQTVCDRVSEGRHQGQPA